MARFLPSVFLLLLHQDSSHFHCAESFVFNSHQNCRPHPQHHYTAMSSSSSADDNYPPLPKKRIVIAGSGIIGTSTAYYLTKDHLPSISSLTIVDPTGSIAPAASGKAGGFLALDWNDHYPPTGRLTRRSFALHEELALTPDGIRGGKEEIM